MKKILFSIMIIFSALFITGCSNYKQVAYFQNADSVNLSASKGLYDAHIMPKDELTITVSCTNPEAAAPFNLAVGAQSSLRVGTQSQNYVSMLNYLVENDGTINYPVLGKLHVVGMTKLEVQNMIQEKIAPYFNKTEKPIVTVRMANYRITVIGEFGGPKVINVSSEKISILEALAQAGDLTIYGKRRNVMLIRESATGEKSIHRLNLNDANLICSPYYYLQQNDVLYVEPLKTKSSNSDLGTLTTFSVSVIGSLISIASLVVNILR